MLRGQTQPHRLRYDSSVPTYHVENFGCRATQADGAALERQFETRGLARAASHEADLVILNTCTVTNSADKDARAAIRRVQRQNPLAKIIVTGCYAQRAPAEIAALPGVSSVIGNSHKHQLAEIALQNVVARPDRYKDDPHARDRDYEGQDREGHDFSRAMKAAPRPALAAEVESQNSRRTFLPVSTLTGNRELNTGNSIYVSDIFAHTELLAAPVFESGIQTNERTRPNLKVQDGCDNRCSFCVIPSVRGQSRSLSLPEIIREVNALVAAGYRELVISGINLGRWGRDLESRKLHFVSLLHTILAETQLEKLRISSVEPMDWSDNLIALVASSPRIAKHAHVPLQSGSDSVLRRMHRKYRPWHYREKIEKIRAAMPTAAIGADVMAGFPGETDAEFESTRRLIEDLPFTYLHVFTYSARPGTPAAAMPNQVPVHIARERNKILRDLAAEKKQAFMQSFIGRKLEAITLNVVHADAGGDRTEALTDNFQKLYLKGRHEPNRWINARIENAQAETLLGTVAFA
ncbi:MAG TPA: tRNA (N(6)-L-threonylcarbamoyladenosine(37)-C(2))-methylthiotransferase MtaB [Candidatus Sulfotelmatobacter sp.]|nr:tRNA (N(6)-L-threonylcarbamoyladenosine(37)-C(2))-methylthiotransferase MtaB [Candidatus Sulfotelmatobacter sp.]